MSFHEKAEALYAKTFDELYREYDQLIEVIDSEHVTVNTANITAALSLQATVISLTILSAQLAIEDEDTADIVTEHVLADTGCKAGEESSSKSSAAAMSPLRFPRWRSCFPSKF